MRIEEIKIELIDILPGRRAVDPNWARAIAEDMTQKGQETPIGVIEIKEPFSKEEPRYRLVAGGHRVEARRLFKAPTIIARIYEQSEFVNEAEIRLAGIKENFIRRGLSVLDRAYDVAEWREIYEQVNGAVKPGKKPIRGKSAPNLDDAFDAVSVSLSFAGSFSAAAQTALNLNKDEIKRSLRIASIAADVRRNISLHRIADNQSELLELAAQSADRQVSIATMLTANPPLAHSVAQAISLIDRVPAIAKTEAWQKVSQGFSKLSDLNKRAVLLEHWDLIEELLAERSAQ